MRISIGKLLEYYIFYSYNLAAEFKKRQKSAVFILKYTMTPQFSFQNGFFLEKCILVYFFFCSKKSYIFHEFFMDCTRQIGIICIDELAEELIAAKIISNMIGSGKWKGNIDTSRIWAHSETQ